MTRIIEHRQDALPDEEVLELRVFKRQQGDVRASVIPVDLTIDHTMMDEMSAPVAQAFLDALALCEKESITALWVHDPLGMFPAHSWPVRTS